MRSRFAPVGLLLLLGGSLLLFVGSVLLFIADATGPRFSHSLSLTVIFVTLVGIVALAIGQHVFVVDAAVYRPRDVAASKFTIGLTLGFAVVLLYFGGWWGRPYLLVLGLALGLARASSSLRRVVPVCSSLAAASSMANRSVNRLR